MIQTVNLASFRVVTKNKPLKRMYKLLGGQPKTNNQNSKKVVLTILCFAEIDSITSDSVIDSQSQRKVIFLLRTTRTREFKISSRKVLKRKS